MRAASKHGGQSEANCHPFRWDRYTFMHNGDVGGFARLRRSLLTTLGDEAFAVIQGNTDSEHVFALVVDELLRSPLQGVERMVQALQNALRRVVELGRAHGVTEPHYLNLALADGVAAVACRFTTHDGYDGESLFVHTGQVYVCSDGVCQMLAPDQGTGCVLVSSEPLSDDPGWDMMPRNSLARIDSRGIARVQPIAQ
ncbi:MAG: class II glutamine amidotransferase [Planctomycetes bacterium]|nr:class II glutamine amidotransferase [Planctomycetota bacterium]